MVMMCVVCQSMLHGVHGMVSTACVEYLLASILLDDWLALAELADEERKTARWRKVMTNDQEFLTASDFFLYSACANMNVRLETKNFLQLAISFYIICH